MNKIQIKTTVNFQFLQENWNLCRGIVLPGGTRSSKTVAALQFIIYYCLINTGKDIVICRDTLKNLKRTTLKDFQAICYGHGGYAAMAPTMKLNKSDMTTQINGNSIEFIGLIDDPMRAYGLRSDLFYINEAISTYKHTFSQLNQRCADGFILDCNPSLPNSWVYELEKRPDVEFFRTDYTDNPFLEKAIIKEIESYQDTPENVANGTADPRKWSIYGQGIAFKGKEIIYPDWDTYKEDPKEYDNCFFGLDWGHNHPLAVTKVFINGRDLYFKEVIYKSLIDDLDKDVAQVLKQHPEIEETYVVCDSSEPRSINQLIELGIPAFAVKKPPGSVLDGIRKVNGYRMHVHEESHNIQRELNNYKWKIDQRTDTVIDVPVKENDDALDSLRYPVYTFG